MQHRLIPEPSKQGAEADGSTGTGAVVAELEHAILLLRAAEGLRKSAPELSAGKPLWGWQRATLIGFAVVLILGVTITPHDTIGALFAVLAIPFFFVVVLRAIALRVAISEPFRDSEGVTPPEDHSENLPAYTVLVPLFREAAIVPDLLLALARIDYPMSKLEIILIVESVDAETRAAIADQSLEPNMRVISVPDGEPRTKPRALNYAMHFAKGDYIAVYDAEDWPEPDQLLKSLALLDGFAGPIGCVQARLNIYNPNANWLTRQFTIEYTALFDCILPALQKLGLPVPLGGTSNHFPRSVLTAVGGWDPYNVTEDADLGIRMARNGFEVAVVSSTTWEQAPDTFRSWLKQRTRWLKGWMQTYLVHMREPLRFWSDVGTAKFLGFQVLMGGLILSALVHPWFYVLSGWEIASGHSPFSSQGHVGSVLWWIGLVNLVLGYSMGIALGAYAVLRRGWSALAWHSLLMPAYWILISLAAYRALYQLVSAPYLWEKTDHTPRHPHSSAQGSKAAISYHADGPGIS